MTDQPADDQRLDDTRSWITEDGLANLIGAAVLGISLAAVFIHLPESYWEGGPSAEETTQAPIVNPLRPYLAKPGAWSTQPLAAWRQQPFHY